MTARETAGPAPLSERFRWGVRLTAQGLRRHRGVSLGSVAGFACATAALVACVALAHGPVTSLSPATGTAQLVAFLNDALPAGDRDALAVALRQLPGVAGVRVLPSDEALGRMRAELGPRAALLDGVEDGFLPTTLEIALRPGKLGTGRADELAWRLRRMAGISDVDVLRNEADHRLLTEQETGRRLRWALATAGGLLALLALVLVGLMARRRRADAMILDGLGFTAWAVSGPAFAIGAAAGAAGAAVILMSLKIVERFASLPAFAWVGTLAARGLGGALGQVAAFAAATLLGGAIAWWGTRPPGLSDPGGELAREA